MCIRDRVYEQLLATIRSLDEEKEHMLAVEKSKTVFLRSASHELKTCLLYTSGIGLNTNDEKIQWHPAFDAALQIEFGDEAKYLEFDPEHLISKKPMHRTMVW